MNDVKELSKSFIIKDLENRFKQANDLHAILDALEMQRFKYWYNPKYLKNIEIRRADLNHVFRIYLKIVRDHQAKAAALRKNGHDASYTAMLSAYSSILDFARNDASHESIINAIKAFIVHTDNHLHCTPIWGQMQKEAVQLQKILDN